MPSLPVPELSSSLQPTAQWAAALVHVLARAEAAGRRSQRLTEPGLATWQRFRGRMTSVDLLALQFEDAAVQYPVPFSAQALLGAPALDLHLLPQDLVDRWVSALAELPLSADGTEFITHQARSLGLPTRLARADLHQVKPHQRVLELPGTGGQLAAHIVTTQVGLSLRDNVTVACGHWTEQVLAGLIALELNAPDTAFAQAVSVEALVADVNHPLRQQAFDFVVGLHPDKGGLWTEAQLLIWFDKAKVLLV